MDSAGCQRQIFRNLHDTCHDILFDSAGFPMTDTAGIDRDFLAADRGALHRAIGRDSRDYV
jgi:hypothetical protein